MTTFAEQRAQPSAIEPCAIRVRGVSKRFDIYDTPLDRLKHILFPGRGHYARPFWALQDIDFAVGPGETVGIIGSNGSGKSTLLQIVCGTLRPTSGEVEIRGRVAALLELGAGFNPEFTGRENVHINASMLGMSREQIQERFASIEQFAEIGDFIDQPVKTYSSGMYVRLAFAVAIHVDPSILIIDEALAVGDARFQAKCFRRIRELKESGVTLLFVSHDVGSVRALCERAVWLDRGRVRLSGDAFAVTAQYAQFMSEGDSGPDLAADAGPATGAGAPPAAASPSRSAGAGAAADAAPDAAQPINHWGTHPGSIVAAGIFDAQGQRKNVFGDLEPMVIRIRLRIPERADRSTLSVAFSIKDTRGTDLIVRTTHDEARLDFTQAGQHCEVEFRLLNRLNNGKYLLVAALEDRSSRVPQYYEYIEGAQYFSSHLQRERFGLFVADVEERLANAPDGPNDQAGQTSIQISATA